MRPGTLWMLSSPARTFSGDTPRISAHAAADKAFFTSGMAKNAAINADDERAAELLRDVTIPHMTYGIAAEADLFARDIEITENGVSFELRLRNAEVKNAFLHWK